MASWEEIRLLAADLREVQLGSSAKRLSNRNCIELVTKLIASGKLELLTTTSGKEYVTPQYLCTEIKNEVYANGGRMSLSDLQPTIGVDYKTIEEYANRMASRDPDFTMCLGQLISKDYVRKLIDEVDAELQRKGKLALSDITQRYDLPTKFVNDNVLVELGRRIRGSYFGGNASVIYTNAFVDEQMALLRGALFGCTRLLPIKRLVQDFAIESSLVFKCFDALHSRGFICGTLLNGHQIDRTVYVPDVLMTRLESHLQQFYRNNNYISYAYVKKFGVGDYGQLIGRVLSSDSHSKTSISLVDCVISSDLFEQLEAAAVETLLEDFWLDMNSIAPVFFSADDTEHASRLMAKNHADWVRCDDGNFFVDAFVSRCALIFDPLILDKVETEGPVLKKAIFEGQQPSSSLGGAKKKPAVKGKKKKKGGDKDDDDDRDAGPKFGTVFMTELEIVETLRTSPLGLTECPEDVLHEVADRLFSILSGKYRDRINSVLLTRLDGDRKTHAEVADKVATIYTTLRLSDLAAGEFDETVAGNLRAYLLRSLATDILHLALGDFANIANPLKMTKKERDAAIRDLPSPCREYFEGVVSSLNEKSLEPFYDAMDKIALPNVCSLSLRSPDKKTRAAVVAKYVGELRGQLDAVDDCASALHICCLLLLAKYGGHVLHASGKFVPSIIGILVGMLPTDVCERLTRAQADVVAVLKKESNCERIAEESVAQLKSMCF